MIEMVKKDLVTTAKILKTVANELEAKAKYREASTVSSALNSILTLELAFEQACDDAADGCCPNEMTDDYECAQCKNCSNKLGNREDSGKDAECWKEYYLKMANDKMNI